MSELDTHLRTDDVLDLLLRSTGITGGSTVAETPLQGVSNQTYLVPQAGLVVKVRPCGHEPCRVPNAHWPAYTCALFGNVPNGGVRSLLKVTQVLHREGGLPVPAIRHLGEGTGPEGSDFTIGEILPGRPFDWEDHRMGRQAARALGDHLGRLHAATVRTDGFGVFGGEPVRWTQWWPRFAASYSILADEVCEHSPALRGFRWRLDLPLARATRSPAPRAFPLVCIDQNPSHYLSDSRGEITGFVDVEGHLFAPAEWELTTVMMWMPHPGAFRQGYERHRMWPEGMDEMRDAYATYTLLEWLRCTRLMMEREADASALEAWLIGTLV